MEKAVISSDGVKEFNSGGQTLEVLSLQFLPCRQVYHVSVWRKDKPLSVVENGMVDELAPLTDFVEDIIGSLPRQVQMVCCDAPKRASCRGQKSSSGYFSCDYCLAPGEQFLLPSGKTQPRWPFSQCFGKPLRTNAEARDTENPPPGIEKRSPLLQLDYDKFDMIHGMPADQMHTVAGVVKRLFEMCFTLKNPTGRSPPAKIRRIPEERLRGLTWNVMVSWVNSLTKRLSVHFHYL